MDKSTIAGFNLPQSYDECLISDISDNFDKLDGILKFLLAKAGYSNKCVFSVKNADISGASILPYVTDMKSFDFKCTGYSFKMTAEGVSLGGFGGNGGTFKVYPYSYTGGKWTVGETVKCYICARYDFSAKTASLIGFGKNASYAEFPTGADFSKGPVMSVEGDCAWFPIAEFDAKITSATAVETSGFKVYSDDEMGECSVMIRG